MSTNEKRLSGRLFCLLTVIAMMFTFMLSDLGSVSVTADEIELSVSDILVSVNGKDLSEGAGADQVTVKNGDIINMSVNWSIDNNTKQYDYYYNLTPVIGLSISSKSEESALYANGIQVGTYTLIDGVLHLHFNESVLDETSETRGGIMLDGVVSMDSNGDWEDNSEQVIGIANKEFKVTYNSQISSNLSVGKSSGAIRFENGNYVIKYTVDVTAQGFVNNIVLSDQMTTTVSASDGTSMPMPEGSYEFDADSIKAPSGVVCEVKDGKLIASFPDKTDKFGEDKYTIEYSVILDKDYVQNVIGDKNVSTSVNNKVNISGEDPQGEVIKRDTTSWNNVTRPRAEKSGYLKDDGTVEWTVCIYPGTYGLELDNNAALLDDILIVDEWSDNQSANDDLANALKQYINGLPLSSAGTFGDKFVTFDDWSNGVRNTAYKLVYTTKLEGLDDADNKVTVKGLPGEDITSEDTVENKPLLEKSVGNSEIFKDGFDYTENNVIPYKLYADFSRFSQYFKGDDAVAEVEDFVISDTPSNYEGVYKDFDGVSDIKVNCTGPITEDDYYLSLSNDNKTVSVSFTADFVKRAINNGYAVTVEMPVEIDAENITDLKQVFKNVGDFGYTVVSSDEDTVPSETVNGTSNEVVLNGENPNEKKLTENSAYKYEQSEKVFLDKTVKYTDNGCIGWVTEIKVNDLTVGKPLVITDTPDANQTFVEGSVIGFIDSWAASQNEFDKITFDGFTVTTDKETNSFTITVDVTQELIDKAGEFYSDKISFYYQTRVDNDKLYASLIEYGSYGSIEAKNTAVISQNGTDITKDASTWLAQPKVITKDGEYHEDVPNSKMWGTYTIDVNPTGAKLGSGSGELVVKDIMGAALTLRMTSVECYEITNEGKVKIDCVPEYDAKNNTVTFIVPDETHVEINYTADIDPLNLSNPAIWKGHTENEVQLADYNLGGSETKTSFATVESNVGAWVENTVADIQIFKFTRADDGSRVALNGAKFNLYSVYDNTGNAEVKLIKENVTTTDGGEDGYIILKELPLDRVYKLVEVEAPEGFIPGDDYYFMLTGHNGINNLPDEYKDLPEYKAEAVISYENDEIAKVEFSGTKTWRFDNAALRPDEITVSLYADGVKTDLEPVWSDTDTDKWSYKFDAVDKYVYSKSNDGMIKLETDAQITTVNGKATISKVSVESSDELIGSVLTVTNSDGVKVESWTAADGGHIINNLIVNERYTLTSDNGYESEFTINAEGYVTIRREIEYTVKEEVPDGYEVSYSDDTRDITNTKIADVEVSKFTITDGTRVELPGASLSILDKNNKVVESWISQITPHKVKAALIPGETYTLVEITAPDGYFKAEKVEFTVNSDGSVTKVEMEDEVTRTEISKVAVTGGDELPGAELTVKNSKGEVVASWTSTTEKKVILGLIAGESYTLTEVRAPEGYKIAEDITFTVNEDGTVTKVEMIDEEIVETVTEISKVAVTGGEEIGGAKLKILDKDGKTVEEWTSEEGKVHTVIGLTAGETYTLVEETAPAGYLKAEQIEFTVNVDGSVTKVEMIDEQTVVKISKVDVSNGEELAGATLVVRDSEGNEIEKWVSDGTVHEIRGLIAGGEYTLTEISAPDGYEIAETITFVVSEDGNAETVVKMEDKPVKITETVVSKVSAADGSELAGATLVVKDSTGKEIEKWVSDGTEHKIYGLTAGEKYTLTEISAPDGYLVAETIEFTVNADGTVTKVTMKDAQTETEISKVDATSGEELEGAKLTLKDADGNVVESWTSGTTAHKIKGLTAGAAYTLVEETAPNGYLVAEEITFTVNADGTVTKVTMKDAQTETEISKVDATSGEELEGAKLTLKDADGNVVESWTSGTTAHKIKGLTAGAAYTLVEETAPNGYLVAEEITFTVNADGTVTKVTMKDAQTETEISKVDATSGEELEGAKLTLKDADGNVVESWTSGTTAHKIKGLTAGAAYTLVEETAPNGYLVAEEITFTVNADGTVTKVTMKDAQTETEISKVAVTGGEELAGATLKVVDKNGEVVETWVSGEKPHVIKGLTAGEEYTLIEETAPDGYLKAESITFVVKDNGEVTRVEMIDEEIKETETVVEISKVAVTGGEELAGATLKVVDKNGEVVETWVSGEKPHVIKGLTAGEEYTLIEETAPDGYLKAESITFVVKDNGEVTRVEMIDEEIKEAETVVEISKVAVTGGEELAGATLKVVDKNGEVVETWVSGEKPHVIKGLTAGEEYTLIEETAPDGYLKAEEIKFTVNSDGTTTKVEMVDEQTVVKISKVDATSGEELTGAKLVVKDKDGNVVDEWTSEGKVHEIYGLIAGETYTLTEITAPEGYEIAETIEFVVSKDGKAETVIVMEDKAIIDESSSESSSSSSSSSSSESSSESSSLNSSSTACSSSKSSSSNTSSKTASTGSTESPNTGIMGGGMFALTALSAAVLIISKKRK